MTGERRESDVLREAVFARIVAEHAGLLYKVARSVLRHAEDSEDAVQDALLKLFRGESWREMQAEGGIRDERAFLARVVWRAALDRRQARREGTVEDGAELRVVDARPSPEVVAGEMDERELLRELMEELPEELREPLVLSAMEELTSREVGMVMGLPEGTVRTRLMRARGMLRARFEARFAQEMEREAALRPATRPRLFGFAESVKTRRSAASMWTAVGVHVAVIAAIGWVVAERTSVMKVPVVQQVNLLVPPPPVLPVAPRMEKAGGGGGQRGLTPVTQGHLPKFAEEQVMPPKAPPMEAAKLTVEPTVVVQKDLKMADNTMPNLGLPNSTLKGVSMGSGRGTGLGSGDGNGVGPGSGGGMGGGVMHAGSVQQAPKLIYQIDPEFSEEARRAKFSGDVQVYLIVDEKGLPTHVRVVRGAGMGLDEKAVEAVRQYRFKPAMQDGKAVKVDLYINVRFDIF